MASVSFFKRPTTLRTVATVVLGLAVVTAMVQGLRALARIQIQVVPPTRPAVSTSAPVVVVTGQINYRSLWVTIAGAGCVDRHVMDVRIVGSPGDVPIQLPNHLPHAMDAENAITLTGAAPPPDVTTIEVSGVFECTADYKNTRPRTAFRHTIVLRDAGAL